MTTCVFIQIRCTPGQTYKVAEEIVLQWETSLRAIAGVADVVPAMENGPDNLTMELVN